MFCQKCGTILTGKGNCSHCNPQLTAVTNKFHSSKIYLMPHSSKRETQFKTVDDFVEYLENELPEHDPIIYRNNYPRSQGKIIFVFQGKILGECDILDYQKAILEENFGYKYTYTVKRGSIRVYNPIIHFKDFRKKANLSFNSTNYAPSISTEQYDVLQSLLSQ